MKKQINITLVVDYDYDERQELDEIEIAMRVANLIRPNLHTIEDGMKLEDVTAYYEDDAVMYY